jgi:hypothetical protein
MQGTIGSNLNWSRWWQILLLLLVLGVWLRWVNLILWLQLWTWSGRVQWLHEGRTAR